MEIWIAILVICVMLTIVLLNIPYADEDGNAGTMASGYLVFGGSAVCTFLFMLIPSTEWIMLWVGLMIIALSLFFVSLFQFDPYDPVNPRHKVRATDFQRLLGKNRTERG